MADACPARHVFVGKVFATFPFNCARQCNVIIGIEVTDNPFGTRNHLILQDPANPKQTIRIFVETIECDRKRTNVATPGRQYGVKPLRRSGGGIPLCVDSCIEWHVFVSKTQSNGAAKRTPMMWDRPHKPKVLPPVRFLGQTK